MGKTITKLRKGMNIIATDDGFRWKWLINKVMPMTVDTTEIIIYKGSEASTRSHWKKDELLNFINDLGGIEII